MKKIIKKILRLLPLLLILKEYFEFKKKDDRFSIKWNEAYPHTRDKSTKTNFDAHYIYHTAWAARKLKEINPKKHIDISSSLYFCVIASAFIPIDFYDYRPADIKLSNLSSGQADLTKLFFSDSSIPSLSCLHTVEHVGLGRYGDPIDPKGDLVAISELKRVISSGGSLLFVVPVGQPKIQFNAHRIYSFEQIMDYFKDLKLKEFSLLTDSGDFIENAKIDKVKDQKYGCGCFWFIKE